MCLIQSSVLGIQVTNRPAYINFHSHMVRVCCSEMLTELENPLSGNYIGLIVPGMLSTHDRWSQDVEGWPFAKSGSAGFV